MKIFLFNAYDIVGQTYLNEKPIMATSEIACLLAYYNSFVKEKDPLKNPYGSKTVNLVIFGFLECSIENEPDNFKEDYQEYNAKEVVIRINQIMAERGVEDYILDETAEEEKK